MLASSLIFLFIIFFSTFASLNAFSQNGYNIKDLTSTNTGGFTSEASSWLISTTACPACVYSLPASTCNTASDVIVYGGPYFPIPASDYGFRFYQRTYPATGGTTAVALEFDAWLFAVSPIDNSFNVTAIIWISLNGTILDAVNPGAVIKVCGSSISPVIDQGVTTNYYSKYRIQNLMSATGNASLLLWWALPTTTTSIKSVAVRNINIFPMPSTANSGYGANFPCAAPYEWDGSACSICFTGCASCSTFGNGNCIGCKSSYYDYLNGYCRTTCDGPLAPVGSTNVCAKRCSTGYYWDRDLSCMSTCSAPLVPGTDSNGFAICTSPCAASDFVYPDGSCAGNCNAPLTTNIVKATLKLCLNPCLNGGSGISPLFLYPDGSCSSTCQDSLSEKTTLNIKYCYSSCNTNDFIYPDGSCSGSCPAPLTNKVQYTLKFCSSPCDANDPSLFLYPEGTCKNTCPDPLSNKVERKIKYCYSNCGSQFIYPDASCSGTCDFPLKEKTECAIPFCVSPCDPNDPSLFLYPNSSCVNSCLAPLKDKIERKVLYCYSQCGSQWVYPDASCSGTCDLPLVEKVDYTIPFCNNPCSSTQYLYANGSCLPDCPSPLIEKEDRDIKLCINPCSDPTNQYLKNDGTCESSCLSPLLSRFESGVKYCWNPCDSNTEYLFDNGECSPQCDPPLEMNIDPGFVQYCHNPCSVNNTFLYSNGSCMSTCPDPLEQMTKIGVKHCVNPCNNTDDYLYSNKSCSSQCPYPLSNREEPAAKYCFSPCDDYFYKNGSCLQGCNPPYVKSQSYGVDQCLSPCEDPNKEYFYEAEQVCKPTCISSYESKIVDGVKVCSQKPQMTEKEIEETENLVSSIKSQGQVTEAGMKAASALSSGSPSFAWLAGQASMLFYIRYINLNYTPKLKLVFSLQDANPFDFTVGINLPKGLEEKLKDRDLPDIFERYEIHSNFLYNSWDMLSSSLLILGIILVLSVVKMFTAKYTKVDRVLAGVLGSLKWNTLLMVICGSFGKLYFDASLQLQAGSVDSAWEILSILLAIVMIFFGVVILALNGKVVGDLWRSRNVKSSREEMEKKWKNFELFFQNCERSSLASFGCMGIFLGRTIAFNLIVANLYNYPLTQTVLINLITFGMAGYLISKRPLKNLLEFAQILLSEVFVMIVNTCALIIAIMDHAQIEGRDLRNDLCNTIITATYMFTLFSLAFLVIQVIIALFLFAKILRRLKAQGQLHLRGVSNALFFGNKENTAVGEENNNRTKKLSVQIQPQRKFMREVSHTQSEGFNITQQINETENRRETSGIFIPHRTSKRRITSISRNIRPSLSFLDHSAVEMLPSEGSFHYNLGSNPNQSDLFSGVNQQVSLECNNRDLVVQTVREKRDLGLPDTISQYRKMRNYLRRNQDRRQQEK